MKSLTTNEILGKVFIDGDGNLCVVNVVLDWKYCPKHIKEDKSVISPSVYQYADNESDFKVIGWNCVVDNSYRCCPDKSFYDQMTLYNEKVVIDKIKKGEKI